MGLEERRPFVARGLGAVNPQVARDPGCAEGEQLPGVEKRIVYKRGAPRAGLQKRCPNVKLRWCFSTIREQPRGNTLTFRGALRLCRNRKHCQALVFVSVVRLTLNWWRLVADHNFFYCL